MRDHHDILPRKVAGLFLGEYYTNFTGQGRVVLPKKFRQEVGEKKVVILSRGFEGCIWGFAAPDWEKEAAKQLELPVTEKTARDLRRYLFSAAESIDLDEQGRFVIPKALLEYGSLGGSLPVGRQGVVIVGAGDHFEVWDPEAWKRTLNNLTKQI